MLNSARGHINLAWPSDNGKNKEYGSSCEGNGYQGAQYGGCTGERRMSADRRCRPPSCPRLRPGSPGALSRSAQELGENATKAMTVSGYAAYQEEPALSSSRSPPSRVKIAGLRSPACQEEPNPTNRSRAQENEISKTTTLWGYGPWRLC